MPYVIVTDSLSKQYGGKNAVENLDLRIPAGSIYGLLGPNGAGKSTTLKLLLSLLKPTAGTIKIFGQRSDEKNRLQLLSRIGSLIESPSYYGHLSGRENLELICTLKNVPKAEILRVLRLVRMDSQQDKKVREYSLGMKQRLGIAAALIGNPKLLLLDEPTNGLDPAGIQEMRRLICSLPRKCKMTVIVSSHLLSEIDQMATHIGIIDKGQLIFQDTLASLHEHSPSKIMLRTSDDTNAMRILKQNHIPAEWQEHTIYLRVHSDTYVEKAVISLVTSGIGVLRIMEEQMSLEDIFLNLTGRQVSL